MRNSSPFVAVSEFLLFSFSSIPFVLYVVVSFREVAIRIMISTLTSVLSMERLQLSFTDTEGLFNLVFK